MNDQPKRRRRKKECADDIQIHAWVDQKLLDAVKKPNCSLSYTLNRALRIALEKDRPTNLKSVAIRIRGLKADMARINTELSELRETAKALGVKDIRAFEESLAAWE